MKENQKNTFSSNSRSTDITKSQNNNTNHRVNAISSSNVIERPTPKTTTASKNTNTNIKQEEKV